VPTSRVPIRLAASESRAACLAHEIGEKRGGIGHRPRFAATLAFLQSVSVDSEPRRPGREKAKFVALAADPRRAHSARETRLCPGGAQRDVLVVNCINSQLYSEAGCP
jgi:hypothetical protein